MASNYVIVSIKLCLDGGHGNVRSSFGGCTTSGFDVIEGSSRRPFPVARCKTKTWYDRVNRPYNELSAQWLIVTKTAYLTFIYFLKNRENMRRKLV